MLKQYYYLTKPGIIYGNVITALGGFFLAAKGEVNFQLLIAMVFGLSFVIASACVINNIFDKEMDAKMERTKHRATVTGKISRTKATIFAVILLGLGIYFLQPTTYALFTSLVGWLVYVAFYTPFKSKTVHATLIGSIAGATPPVVGYTAVTNQVDLGAILLFIILVTWQMPHFYSISIFRQEEYHTAGVPVLSVKKRNFYNEIKYNDLYYFVYPRYYPADGFPLHGLRLFGDYAFVGTDLAAEKHSWIFA